jgi:hypothetical protein
LSSASHALSFAERVEAQRAIEGVYWRHRIWPAVNPGPKPALEAVVSEEALRAAVARYLKLSNALDVVWGQPVTGRQLQAELNRMASSTRSPQVLRELFEALGNDPRRIAETLVRPKLVERLARDWYAWDARFHGALRERAEAALAETAGGGADALRDRGAEYREVRWVRGPGPGEPDAAPSRDDSEDLIRIPVSEEEWEGLVGRLSEQVAVEQPFDDMRWEDVRPSTVGERCAALRVGVRGALREEDDRFEVTEVFDKGEGELTVAVAIWPKVSFEAWWEGRRGELGAEIEEPLEDYSLPAVADGSCKEDTWEPTASGPPRGARATRCSGLARK